VTASVLWAKGGEARVVIIGRDAITLDSSVPAPPGSRIDGTLAGDVPTPLRIKIHASRRQPDGRFLLEGRPLDLSREARARLERLV
jgi:hypothetical protein